MIETISVNGEMKEVDIAPLTLLCHKDNLNIKIPGRLEINPAATVGRAQSLTADEWTALRACEPFTKLFKMVFTDIEPPENIWEDSMGVKHVVGMILLIGQCAASSQNPFIVMPESFLHPANQAGLADMFIALMKGTV